MSVTTNTKVDKWLKANRCWRREHNIAHARYQLTRTNVAALRAQWELILERLEG
jgi:hypothetical protein